MLTEQDAPRNEVEDFFTAEAAAEFSTKLQQSINALQGEMDRTEDKLHKSEENYKFESEKVHLEADERRSQLQKEFENIKATSKKIIEAEEVKIKQAAERL